MIIPDFPRDKLTYLLKENFTYHKEDLMHIERSLASTVLKPYINYFENSIMDQVKA